MAKTLVLVTAVVALTGGLAVTSPAGSPNGAFENNQCVTCHARTTASPELTSRYLEWHFSKHAASGVGCERCHGGDPAAVAEADAHKGMLPPSDRASRTSRANLPETCGACHEAVVSSFVESTHFKRLKQSGLGPSCTTCHNHMASAVATSPVETANYCAYCHNSINGILDRRPEIPHRAQMFMESLARANSMRLWTADLIAEAERRGIDVSAERDQMRLLQGLLFEARSGWHGFGLDAVQTKADKAFDEGQRLRIAVQSKLGR